MDDLLDRQSLGREYKVNWSGILERRVRRVAIGRYSCPDRMTGACSRTTEASGLLVFAEDWLYLLPRVVEQEDLREASVMDFS